MTNDIVMSKMKKLVDDSLFIKFQNHRNYISLNSLVARMKDI